MSTGATIKKILQQAWLNFRQAPFRSIAMVLIFFGGGALIEGLMPLAFSSVGLTPLVSAILQGLLGFAVGAYLLLALYFFHLASARGREAGFTAFGAALPDLPAFLSAQFLSGLAFLACFLPALLVAGVTQNGAIQFVFILISLGLLLVVLVRLGFAGLFICDASTGIFEAFHASIRISAGQFWKILFCYLILLIVLILGLLLLVLPVLIASSFTLYAFIALYDSLRITRQALN